MQQHQALSSLEEFLADSFDFLIIGGGTAGCVLANRLSENPDIRVGVIEAGKSHLGDPIVESLAGHAMLLHNPEYDWVFKSSPQQGSLERVYHVPRGKMLGGSSGVNFMAYVRPSKEDFDRLSETLGIEGWAWDDIAPYYAKSEHLDATSIKATDREICPIEPSFHGTQGGIHTSLGPWTAPIDVDVLRAFEETSHLARPKDPWSGTHLGFYRSLFAVDRTGAPKRSYGGNGYLVPVLDRPNLRVLTESAAVRILLENGAAKGIEFIHADNTYQVFTKREVILSSGAIQSPQLLELSGIGDPEVLEAAGSECLVPSPEVGNNLQEHPMSAMVYELADGEMSVDSIFVDAELMQEHQRLLAEENGGALSGFMHLMGFVPYSSTVSKTGLNNAIAEMKSATKEMTPLQQKLNKLAETQIGNPHSASIQFVGAPCAIGSTEGSYGNQGHLIVGAPQGRNPCYSVLFSTMYVLSRGSVHIQSSDPRVAPRIDLGFLSHPTDASIMAAGAAFIDRVFQSEAVRHKIKSRVNPGPEVDLQDLDQAKEWVNKSILTYNHLLGTCALGEVVDERLKVKGVSRLRVVDASVLPMESSGNIMATVYAVAEKAADVIKEHYGL